MKKYLLIILSLIGIITVGCSSNSVSSAEAALVNWTDEDLDSSFDASSATIIELNGSKIDVSGTGAKASGSTLTIEQEGTYIIEGTGDDINIIINADKQLVRIVLNNATINVKEDPGFLVSDASKVIFILPPDTVNTINGGDSLLSKDMAATIYSSADITINGTGTLNINSQMGEGIHSKDTLKLVSGNINVEALGDGLKGKDYVAVKEANINISAKGDGIESTNEDTAGYGFILIENGNINIKAEQDGLASVNSTIIQGGNIEISTGNGGAADDVSRKGINANGSVEISGGNISINSQEDGINGQGNVTLKDADIVILAGDDGIHSDETLHILSGNININKAYEGIEASTITIDGGDIRVVATDDGINIGGAETGNQQPGGAPGGASSVASDSPYLLTINGGNIIVEAEGDGIDINGNITMNGGYVAIYGPTNNGNGALDYDGTFQLNDGKIMAGGSLGMVMTPSNSSKIPSVSIGFSTAVAAGSKVSIKDAKGEELYSYTSSKVIQSLVVADEGLVAGSTYSVYIGDSKYIDFTVSGINNSAGATGNGGGMMGGQKTPGTMGK